MSESMLTADSQNQDVIEEGASAGAETKNPGVVATNDKFIEDQNEEEEIEEEDEDDEYGVGSEEDEVLRTEFMNLKDALMMGQQQISRIPHVSAQSLRAFLSQDLYPVLVELADYANWYVGDLHQRIVALEENSDQSGGEGIDPEFAEQLINFIGMSLQIFGVVIQVKGADPKLLHMAQLLIAQAPGLIARIQEITLVEMDDEDDEDDVDENDDNEEPPEILEPVKQKMAQENTPATEAPVAEAVQSNNVIDTETTVSEEQVFDEPESSDIDSKDSAEADSPVVEQEKSDG